MEYLGEGGPVVNSPNVHKGSVKNRTLQTLQTFHNFSKEHYKHNNKKRKTTGNVSCVKEKKNLLTNFHVSKKGKTSDKVSCQSVMSNF